MTWTVVLVLSVLVPTLTAQVARPPVIQVEKEKKNASDAKAVKTPRVDPPNPDTYVIRGHVESQGDMVYARGRCPAACAEIETVDLLIKADEIDYNKETEYAEARGNVYYESFKEGNKMYADRVEYQVDEQTGKFYGHLHGTSQARVVARPGLLTTSNPFYFEGDWAEKIKRRIKLYDGFVTDCIVPRPAWKLTGRRFDIISHERAKAYWAFYRLRGIPIFYSPFFYKSLKKNPRRTGFLLPDITRSTLFGWMYSAGFFWAINRSYDVTYHPEYMSERGLGSSLEFRGRPTDKSDFDFTLHGVDDREHQGGYVINVVGHDDLGHGWTAIGQINYLDSYLFRQAFTQSFTEAISSETHSSVDITKHWDSFGINIDYSRDVNFQSTAPGDRILIRKLPELEFVSRDRQLLSKLFPIWYSFDATYDLLHRDQPQYQTRQFTERIDIAPRVMTAFSWKGFSIVPSFTFRNTFYDASFNSTGQVTDANVLRSSRETMVDFLFPTLERVFKSPKIFGAKMKHVIEARATYRLVNGVENFNDIIRFDSTDLITNTNEILFSITNRFYVKSKDGAVRELFSWALSQKRFFDPTFGGTLVPGVRNVNWSSIELTGFAFLDEIRGYSPVVSAIRFQPDHFNLEWRADYDPKSGHLVDSAVSGGGRWADYFLNVGLNQLRPDPVLAPKSNQVTAAFGFGKPNKRGWNVGGNIFYDYRTGELNYLSSQVTRNWDCCGVSVQYRRSHYGIISNDTYQMSFSISNIGSFGTLRKQESMF